MVYLIYGASVATAKWHNMERHFRMCHISYHANYATGSKSRAEKAHELKAVLREQQSFFTGWVKKSTKSNQSLT